MKLKLILSDPVDPGPTDIRKFTIPCVTEVVVADGRLAIRRDGRDIIELADLITEVPGLVFYRIGPGCGVRGADHPIDFRTMTLEAQR
jgi:hypothetical protein